MMGHFKTGYVYSNELLKYRFGDEHPFNQMRLKLTTELLEDMGVLDQQHIITPEIASEETLALVHTYDYIEAIQHASRGILSDIEARKYGLDEETSPFKHMHQHSARIVGGALKLADAIMTGKVQNGCHLGGGLHHSLPGKANGFCVYNDVAVTAAYLSETYDARVLCIDTDAHHGDGTQWSFYTNPNILNYSIHETGKFLFPGTGHYTERGKEHGYGHSVNLPLEPFTEDESFLKCFKTSISAVIEAFRPDIILSVHGVDLHYLDPLTHMSCTLESLYQIPYMIQQLAERYTDGKVLMFGGGGYNIWDVVPRAWAHVYLALQGQPIQHGPLQDAWLNKWQPYSSEPLPTTWTDECKNYQRVPRAKEISDKNWERTQQICSWFE